MCGLPNNNSIIRKPQLCLCVCTCVCASSVSRAPHPIFLSCSTSMFHARLASHASAIKKGLCFRSSSIDTLLLWQRRCKWVGRRITDVMIEANVLCFDREHGSARGVSKTVNVKPTAAPTVDMHASVRGERVMLS